MVDETSLRFDGIADVDAEEAIDLFNDTLSSILRSGVPVGKVSFCLEFECRTGIPLYSLLYERTTEISLDTLRRCSDLLDRCTDWDDEFCDVVVPCLVDGEELDAWSISYAFSQSSQRLMACLTCSVASRVGKLTVQVGQDNASIFFFSEGVDLPAFWQNVLDQGLISQHEFFTLAYRAYPRLLFHEELDFRHFRGSYTEVYHWAVTVFRVLNNHFSDSFKTHRGVRQLIQADMSSHGINVSPDSPKTHENAKAMRQRNVTLGNATYKCEWHAKRLWNVDRIHFTVPEALADGRLMVGIFTEHLDN